MSIQNLFPWNAYRFSSNLSIFQIKGVLKYADRNLQCAIIAQDLLLMSIPIRDIDCVKGLYANLPFKPYCTDNFSDGLLIKPKDVAVLYRHLQLNEPTLHRYITFDCDSSQCIGRIRKAGIKPSFIVQNRDDFKFHAVIELETPVHKYNGASLKAINWLADIQNAMTALIGADPAYNGLLTKNPYHNAFYLERFDSDDTEPYTLGELNGIANLFQPKAVPVEQCYIGRNVEMFHAVRKRAYRQVKHYATQEQFVQACIAMCVEYTNTYHKSPLPYSECKATGKSIGKWTWNRYTGEGGLVQWTPEQQSKGGLASSRNRRLKAQERNESIVKMYFDEGLGYGRIAAQVGVSKSTVQLVVKDYRKAEPYQTGQRIQERFERLERIDEGGHTPAGFKRLGDIAFFEMSSVLRS